VPLADSSPERLPPERVRPGRRTNFLSHPIRASPCSSRGRLRADHQRQTRWVTEKDRRRLAATKQALLRIQRRPTCTARVRSYDSDPSGESSVTIRLADGREVGWSPRRPGPRSARLRP
jgi:hypothetical protein